jgi:hypothetical protein
MRRRLIPVLLGFVAGSPSGAKRATEKGSHGAKYAGAKQVADKVWILGAMSESVPQWLEPMNP